MEKPGGLTDSDNISRESHVSVKQDVTISVSLEGHSCSKFIYVDVKRLGIGKKYTLERWAMCTSSEPDHEATPSAPSAAWVCLVGIWG